MEDGNGKLDFGMAGYCMKIYFQQKIMHDAPQVLPSFCNTTESRQPRTNNKTYCVLWGSGDYIVDPEQDSSVLVPFVNGEPVLSTVKRFLFSRGKKGACVKMLTLANRLDEDLRVFDLPSLGLKMLCCPEPRSATLLQSEERITIALANDDNRLACTLLLAEKDFDLSQIQDIFGPALVMLRPEPHPRDFKIKNMVTFMKSYLGLSENWTDFFGSMESLFSTEGARAMFQPIPQARKAYKKQLKGKAPPTDLLSHAPESRNSLSFMPLCGNPNCADMEKGSKLQCCAKCKAVMYCSKECQRQHWKTHKPFCKVTAKKITQDEK